MDSMRKTVKSFMKNGLDTVVCELKEEVIFKESFPEIK
jgi:hypothetical protein